jgi:hypothetical protein
MTKEIPMNRIASALLAVLAACGGNSVATNQNKAGTGSSTLLVTADVSASTTASGPLTSFEVNLHDGVGTKVSGAVVSITNQDLGPVALVEATAGSGKYVNSRASFASGNFQLSVVRGTDNVQGVVVGGPGVNTVNAPAPNAVVSASAPLDVSWTTPSQAKSVSVSTRDFAAQAPDTGSYTIPAASNPARPSQRLTLSRFNEVDIAGGLSGSRMRVTFTSVVDPFVVQ